MPIGPVATLLRSSAILNDDSDMPGLASDAPTYAREFKRIWLHKKEGLPKSKQGPFDSMFSSDGDLEKCWYKMIENYSGRDLTYESDRLLAIQGLVTLMKEAFGYDNHAGLWDKRLVQDLLWETIDHTVSYDSNCYCNLGKLSGRRSSPRAWRQNQGPIMAPSWSWASADQRVTFRGGLSAVSFIHDIEVIDHGRRLNLRGILQPVGVSVVRDYLQDKHFSA